jgi:hypothetical protein
MKTEKQSEFTGRDVHVQYANFDFKDSDVRTKARPLIEWLRLPGEWNSERTLRYLEKKQEQFQQCLEWLSENAFAGVDEKRRTKAHESCESSDLCENRPEIRFLKRHALEHAGVILKHSFGDGMFYTGLELGQKRLRDPLDPLCWHILGLAATFGTVFVHRCEYYRCGKFFVPPTKRKHFCTDSCRALSHAFDYGGLHTEAELKEARLKKNRYMRTHNKLLRRRKKLSRG